MQAFFCSIEEWRYDFKVMDGLECPIISLSVFMSNWLCIQFVAKAWRSEWYFTFDTPALASMRLNLYVSARGSMIFSVLESM